MSFDFAEESRNVDNHLGDLDESDVLCFGCGQGDDVLLSSSPSDRTSAEHNDGADRKPALVPVICLVWIGVTDGLGHRVGIRFSFIWDTCILCSL